MKQRLRTKVWWPGIDQEAEKFCKTCHGCQVVGGPINPEPLRMTELPRGPWQDIAIDFMGPLPSGEYVFAVTDYYSRYVEVAITKKNTAEVAIKSLENMFATHGLPWTVTSDNGPHFVAEIFESFLQENGIEHRKTTPLWPQANGEIERQNRSLLKRMQIARVEGQDWRKAVQTYLIAYRNTPHPTTGMCPAELMFRRKLRTKLPELREDVRLDGEMRDRDREKKEKMKSYADKRRNAKENNLSEGDKVLLKQQRSNKWTTAFERQPYQVIDRRGNNVLVESPEGVRYKRNTTHVKPFQERESGSGEVEMFVPGEGEMLAPVPEILPEERILQQAEGESASAEETSLQGDRGGRVPSEDSNQTESVPVKSPRPVRTRRAPKRYGDYVMG